MEREKTDLITSLFQCARYPEDIITHLWEQRGQFSARDKEMLEELRRTGDPITFLWNSPPDKNNNADLSQNFPEHSQLIQQIFQLAQNDIETNPDRDNFPFTPGFVETATRLISQTETIQHLRNREKIEAFIDDRAEKFCDELERIIANKEKTEFAVFDRNEVAFWYKVAFLTHVFQMRKIEGKMYVHHVEQVTINFLKYTLRQIPRTGEVFDLTSRLVTHIIHDTKEDIKPQEESEIMETYPYPIEFVQQLLRDKIGSVLRETESLENEHILNALTKPVTTHQAPKYPDAEFSAEISKEEKDVLTVASFVFQTLLHASQAPIAKAFDRSQNMDSHYEKEKQLGKVSEVLVSVAPFLYATGNSELVTEILGKNIQLLDAQGRESFQNYFYWKTEEQRNRTQSALARFGTAEDRPFDRVMFDYFRNNNASIPEHANHPLYKEYFFRDLHGSLMFYWKDLGQAFEQHQKDGSMENTLKRVPLLHIGVEKFPEDEFILVHSYPCGVRRIYMVNNVPVLFYIDTPQPQKIFHDEKIQEKIQNLLDPELWQDFQEVMQDIQRIRDGFYYYSKPKLAELEKLLPQILGQLNNRTIYIPEHGDFHEEVDS